MATKVYEAVYLRYIDAFSGSEFAEVTKGIFDSLDAVREAGFHACIEWELNRPEEKRYYRFCEEKWEGEEHYSVYFEGKINWSQIDTCDEILPYSYVEQVTETHIDWHCLRFLDEIARAVNHIIEEWGDRNVNICKGEFSEEEVYDGLASEYLKATWNKRKE